MLEYGIVLGLGIFLYICIAHLAPKPLSKKDIEEIREAMNR